MYSHSEDLLIFSFTCRNQDINWAKNLLSDLGITKVDIKGSEARMTFDDGDHAEVKVKGMCNVDQLKDLVGVLSKNKIAGYSSGTQVFRKPYAAPTKTRTN